MKVVITASGPDLDSPVDPRFGRAAYFIFVDTDTLEYEAVQNPYVAAVGGAGIQAAQLVANKGAQAVISGSVGPNAFQTLSAAGIPMYQAPAGTVRQVLDAFKANQVVPISQPGPGHGGMGRGFGMGFGAGPGRGAYGPGMGFGRGRGMGFGRAAAPPPPPPPPSGGMAPPQGPAPTAAEKPEDLDDLKQMAQQLSKQLEEINKRIADLEEKRKKQEKS